MLQRYAELENGMVGNAFDPRLLNYRMDVERLLTIAMPIGFQVLQSVHRDGLRHDAACVMAGLESERPDDLVKRLEVDAGRLFERAGLSDIEGYLS